MSKWLIGNVVLSFINGGITVFDRPLMRPLDRSQTPPFSSTAAQDAARQFFNSSFSILVVRFFLSNFGPAGLRGHFPADAKSEEARARMATEDSIMVEQAHQGLGCCDRRFKTPFAFEGPIPSQTLFGSSNSPRPVQTPAEATWPLKRLIGLRRRLFRSENRQNTEVQCRFPMSEDLLPGAL